MTDAMNINTLKGKILIMAVLLVALAAMAAAAKPAEAATTCNSYAHAPTTIRDANGWKLILFRSTIQCSGGKASGADILSKGQYYNKTYGKWMDLGGTSLQRTFLYSSSAYALTPRFNCSNANPGSFNVRTKNEGPFVKGADGKWRSLATRYSGYKTITCKYSDGSQA